jgi:hypothetical protein
MAAQLQEFLDGALPAKEAETMRAHLAACASCSHVYEGLSAAGAAVAKLPLCRPSPALRARVLAALARQRRPAAWAAYVSAPALALVCSGLSIGVWLAVRALSLERLLAVWRLLCEPGRAVALFELELARLALLAWRLGGQAAAWLPCAGSSGAFPLQLAAALILAGAILALAVRGAPRTASSSTWRSL